MSVCNNAFVAGSKSYKALLKFLQKTLGQQELHALLSPDIANSTSIMEVLRLAASTPDWADCQRPPEIVLQRILHVFARLEWIPEESAEVTSEFLTGDGPLACCTAEELGALNCMLISLHSASEMWHVSIIPRPFHSAQLGLAELLKHQPWPQVARGKA